MLKKRRRNTFGCTYKVITDGLIVNNNELKLKTIQNDAKTTEN